MPEPIRFVAQAIPATHYLRMVRGTLLKGLTPQSLLPHLWPQVIFVVVDTILTTAFHRQQIRARG